MSDSRTDREALARVIFENGAMRKRFGAYPWSRQPKSTHEIYRSEADVILAAGFTRHTENVFELTATPAQIHAAVDVLRDLNVTDTNWTYTDYEAEHVSGFRFVSADGYMPEELRAYPGDEL
jgi:hypothetical protein